MKQSGESCPRGQEELYIENASGKVLSVRAKHWKRSCPSAGESWVAGVSSWILMATERLDNRHIHEGLKGLRNWLTLGEQGRWLFPAAWGLFIKI